STFGGNPLACAVAIKAMQVLEKESMIDNSLNLGDYFVRELKNIENPVIKEVRGKGLMVGIELKEKARPYCEKLMQLGLLAKETHENVIRLAPPLIINKEDLEWAIDKLKQVF
ncbi:MAG: aminotransferase class III-fold pyridoxal phosphate-dependent enzyme, partial [Bacillota bacterium]